MKLSRRAKAVLPSATLAMTARAQALRAEGRDILALSAGEPDFNTPEHINAAAREAIARGETKYTPVAGTMRLRQSVAAWAQELYGQKYSPKQVIVGTGGKQVLFNAICALLGPGDEALFGTPYWVSYPDMIRFADGVPVEVRAGPGDNFLPQAPGIEAAITEATRLLILNSPSNPTGACYTRAQLQAIAQVLRAHPQVFVISDDIYYGLVYDSDFVGLAQVAPDLAERLLIATGVSKTFAMTGWRIGFGIGPQALIAPMTDLQGAATSGACSIAQAAAVAALTGDQAPIAAMRDAFKKRRDVLVAGLAALPQLEVSSPEGAFYAFVSIHKLKPKFVASSDALCEHLLEAVNLALVPGSAFGDDDYVRLSFACGEDTLNEAVRRFAEGIRLLGA